MWGVISCYVCTGCYGLDCLAYEVRFGLLLEIWVSALFALRWCGIVVVLLYLVLGLILCVL